MSKKTKIKTLIRHIVREEVAVAIQEVITELKQPTRQVSRPSKKTVEKQKFTKNSILNKVLNETANDGEWKTLGNGTYDSSRMNEVVSSQYGDLMNGDKVNADAMVASMGTDPGSVSEEIKDNMFNKDYRSLMKKVDEKVKQKRGM
tara:strand:+ start:21 stop:458 length:438 start_codon:yes stop_codon:yes gene_type:complete